MFTVGGIPAQVQFAGIVGAGLNQFNIVIPPTAPDGDNVVEATYMGSATQAGALVTVQH